MLGETLAFEDDDEFDDEFEDERVHIGYGGTNVIGVKQG